MAAPTPLIPQRDITLGYYPTIPVGMSGYNPTATPPWANAYEQVHLTLSSGETVYVGTVLALLQLVTAMLEQGQHVINPSEDIFIALAGPAKVIIGEMTFQNQEPEAPQQRVFRLRPRASGGLGPQRELRPHLGRGPPVRGALQDVARPL